MRCIDTRHMTDEALQSFDKMMIECTVKVEHFAALATMVWSDVLEELHKRGKVRLTSGSFDDIGNALIQRL